MVWSTDAVLTSHCNVHMYNHKGGEGTNACLTVKATTIIVPSRRCNGEGELQCYSRGEH